MTPADRAFLIKRAVLRALEDCGDFPVTEAALREHVTIKIDHLRPTTAELDAVFRSLDTLRLVVALPSERGPKFRLTDAGRLWLAEHAA